jgi:transposase-like protein
MNKISYKGYRFPPEIIQQAIWLYLRFTLSFRDLEDLLAERGIVVSYETVLRWVNYFGPMIETHGALNQNCSRQSPHKHESRLGTFCNGRHAGNPHFHRQA